MSLIFSHVLLAKVRRFGGPPIRVQRPEGRELREAAAAAHVLPGGGDHRVAGGAAEADASPDVEQNYHGLRPQRPS